MTRRPIPIVALLVLMMVLAGCVRTVELNPENVSAEQAEAAALHYGNIRVEDNMGVIYIAQTLVGADTDTLTMTLVRIVDDGVAKQVAEVILLKEKVVSIQYRENNPWMVGAAVAGTALLIATLYWNINGHF